MKKRTMLTHAVAAACLAGVALGDLETFDIWIAVFLEENKPGEVCEIEARNGEAERTVCGRKSSITLTDAQLKKLRAAFAAEARAFTSVGPEAVAGSRVKVKLRYGTGRRRLELGFNPPAGETAGLSSEMEAIIKELLGVDMTDPFSSVRKLKAQ